jgi:uncharacterized protein (TIGR02391 family)
MPVDLVPGPDDAAALPLDQLALRLLAQISKDERSGQFGIPQERVYINSSVWLIPDREERESFFRLLQEAWDWLLSHGLIASGEPSQPHGTGFTFVTRRGNSVVDDPRGLARVQAEIRLEVDLHPRIRDRIRSQFLLGEYGLAALAALREVEIRVREISKLPESLVVHKLVVAAFKEEGPLWDREIDRGESVATMNLYDGALGVFKNPSSHREVEYDDPTEASEIVLLADLLLRMLDRTERRVAVSRTVSPTAENRAN